MSVALMIVGAIVPGPLVDRASASLDAHVTFSDLAGNESLTVDTADLVRATGIGYPPPRMRGARARLMARRAAEIVAVRNLATKLGHGRRARIRGFRYVSTTFRPDGSVEVVVEHLTPGIHFPEPQVSHIGRNRAWQDPCTLPAAMSPR